MKTNHLAMLGLALGFTAAALWLRPPPPPASPDAPHQGPNLLILVWDTVRADRMSLYGHGQPTTPRLDVRARRGVVFERAVSAAEWTPPSHATLFTGLMPRHHGVKATYKWLDDHHRTLAEILVDAGYDTWSFSANPHLAPDTNLVQGFQQVHTAFDSTWGDKVKAATWAKLQRKDASTEISPAYTPHPKGGRRGAAAFKDAGTVAPDALRDWLRTRQDPARPWFAFVNFMEAHTPRVPALSARKQVMSTHRRRVALNTEASQFHLLAYSLGHHSYTPEELDALRGVYDATLVELDAATDALLEGLAADGQLDNTVVVLTSDHGENLGDHGLFGHKFYPWDTLLRVPLVIWHEGQLAPRREREPVSMVHAFATVLHTLGLVVPEGVDGRLNLLRLDAPLRLLSELVETTPLAVRRIDLAFGVEDKAKWLRSFEVVEEAGEKLVVGSDGGRQLFDLGADPGETADLAEARPERVEALEAALAEGFAGVGVYDPGKRAEGDEAPELPPGTQEMLEGLGYVE